MAFTSSPSPTKTPPWGCAETKGKMELATLETTLQPWPVDVRVFLPPCYDPKRDPGYPLLILLHGQSYTNDQWDRDGMDEAADRLTSAGTIRPMILAMPNESHSERSPVKSNFDAVVANAVLPWIDGKYNTRAERFCRAVGGISRGAGWAMRIGFLRPSLFGSIGAHSYPPFTGDTFALQGWMSNVAVGDLPRFYLDMGGRDRSEYIKANQEIRDEMTRLGIPHQWQWNTGGHDDAYWSAHVEEYLRWYAQAWAGPAW
jgi:enterochelin esterase-like enzyme